MAVGVEAIGGLVAQLDDVGAGGEGSLPRPGQNDGARRAIAVERLERVRELGQDREAQGVQGVGALDRDQGDTQAVAGAGLDADETGRGLGIGQADPSRRGPTSIHASPTGNVARAAWRRRDRARATMTP